MRYLWILVLSTAVTKRFSIEIIERIKEFNPAISFPGHLQRRMVDKRVFNSDKLVDFTGQLRFRLSLVTRDQRGRSNDTLKPVKMKSHQPFLIGNTKPGRMLEQCHQGMAEYTHFPASPHAILF